MKACVECKRRISRERLEALPETTMCRRCVRRHETPDQWTHAVDDTVTDLYHPLSWGGADDFARMHDTGWWYED